MKLKEMLIERTEVRHRLVILKFLQVVFKTEVPLLMNRKVVCF